MTETKRKTGRPRKAASELRNASLPPIRVTAAEFAHVEAQARLAGLDVTEYVRRRALGGNITPRTATADDRAIAELNRIGVNLNQLTHAANTGRTLENLIASALRDVVAAVERLAGRGP